MLPRFQLPTPRSRGEPGGLQSTQEYLSLIHISITLTDIEIETLRDADRQILNAGLAVADREELLTLLEDLGT